MSHSARHVISRSSNLNRRKLCALEILPLIFSVFWIVDFQLKERLISPINRKVFVYDCTYAYSQDRTLSRSNASTGSYNSPAARFSKKPIAEKKWVLSIPY